MVVCFRFTAIPVIRTAYFAEDLCMHALLAEFFGGANPGLFFHSIIYSPVLKEQIPGKSGHKVN
jgi:hypothetical protein